MEKRNIEKELAKQTFKDSLIYLKKMLKIIYRVDNKSFIFIFLFYSLTAIISPVLVILLQEIINDLLVGEFSLLLVILYVCGNISWRVIDSVRTYFMQIFYKKIRFRAHLMLREKLNTLRIEDFQNKEMYDNLERSSQSLYEIPLIYQALLYIISDFVKVLSYLTILLFWNGWIFIVILIFNIISFLKNYKILEKTFVKYWHQTTRERKADYYEYIMQKKETLTELKSLNAFNYILEKYKKVKGRILKEQLELEKKENINYGIFAVIDEVMNAIILVYLILQTLAKVILIGDFYAYRSAIMEVSKAMQNSTEYFAILNIRILNARELINFLGYKTTYVDGTMVLNDIKTIEFKNVWFKYQNRKEYALRGINLLIKNGEKIAFIGENGCGKTTSMKLLMKINHPSKGRILINGVDIEEYSTESLRDKITMLFQEITVYEDTIRENITLNKKRRGEDNILSSVPSENFIKEIKNMPKGIDTILGTWFGDGNDISKGQQQRLALARIFNRGENVLLLDEPNSALDPRAEKELFEYIVNKQKGKTCILTLHVFTNIDQLDRVVMFEKGKIVADGVHDELYKTSEKYKEYYDLQEKPK
jgi:ATP-binding cassette subfamily B protein